MKKYQLYETVKMKERKWPDRQITKPPVWCSVDLRDGNQALPVPMNIDQKLKYFNLLLKIGFKEIELGFPSASQIEYDFARKLIGENLIPDGIKIQVLTQARENLIAKTFESLVGSKQAIVHLYNSTSTLQRKITFGKSKKEILDLAVEGTVMVRDRLDMVKGTEIILEYSPESFTGTELDYALEVCNAVIETWQPEKNGNVIINLPATVEMSTPNVFADRVEWFSENIGRRDQVTISIHTHNDRGTGVAASELALLAGAERIEGTLFGNGERTGNLDIINMALNMFSHGIDPSLDLYDIPKIREIYEECTGMTVHERHPYAGDLVFTAFSGSHQDAIKKGMDKIVNKDDSPWEVPYIPIDPEDIGRSYEAIIRINSQSGKGGVAYILNRQYGLEIPKAMHPLLGREVNKVSDKLIKELSPEEILEVFILNFQNIQDPLKLKTYSIVSGENKEVKCIAEMEFNGKKIRLEGTGNGPIDAFVHGMKTEGWNSFTIEDFHEQAIGTGSGTEAAAYIQIKIGEKLFWGVGRHTDSIAASLYAIISAYNNSFRQNA